MDTLLLVASWACTILLGLSAFFDNWAALSKRPIFKGRPWINTAFLGKTIFKFTWFFSFTALSLGLTFYTAQRSEEKTKSEIAQRDHSHQKHDDSIQLEYKRDIRATNDSNIKSFSKSLEEYNLTYIVNQKKVQSLIKDSINKEIPGLEIIWPTSGSIDTVNDTTSFNLEFKNTGNCPILFNIKVFIGNLYSNNRLHSVQPSLGAHNLSLSQTSTYVMPLKAKYQILPAQYFFLIIGSYTNIKKTIAIPIHEFLNWDLKANSLGTLINFKYNDSIEYIMKQQLHLK